MYVATLYPNRISVRYDGDNRTARKRWEDKIFYSGKKNYQNLSKKKETWRLSYQTQKKIMDSANFLNELAKPKTVKTQSGKIIYNFRTSFITLTLPTEQIHPDKEIKKALNHFLTQLRQKFKLKNYIWKAELQQNENIHFHLIIDKFIHHSAIRYYWNQAINVLGYVDRYQEKYCNMSLKAYAESREIPISKAINGFLRGKKTNWNSPPTENVQAVRTKEMLSYYIAKYVAKNVKEEDEVSEAEKKRIEDFGRVWGRSQSLSAIKYTTRYVWSNLLERIKEIDGELKSFIIKKYDYCTVLYLDRQNVTDKVDQWFQRKMYELAQTYRYPIPDR